MMHNKENSRCAKQTYTPVTHLESEADKAQHHLSCNLESLVAPYKGLKLLSQPDLLQGEQNRECQHLRVLSAEPSSTSLLLLHVFRNVQGVKVFK